MFGKRGNDRFVRNSQSRQTSRSRKTSGGNRSTTRSIRFESLETRQLLSGGPLAGLFESLPMMGGAVLAGSQVTPAGSSTSSQASTSTALSVSDSTPSYGQKVTLTATVTTGSGTVTGLVQFFDGTTAIGTATLHNGAAQFQVGNLNPGTHTITAQYMGSDNYAASASPTPTQANLTVSQAATVTLLSTLSNPIATGEPLSLLARVLPNYVSSPSSTASGGSQMASLIGALFGRYLPAVQSNGLPPTGIVTFQYTVSSSSTVATLGTTLLENGQAELTLTAAEVANLPAGASISAVYSGDSNYAASNSQSISQSVGSTLSSARVFVQASHPVTEGQATTLSITVRPSKSSTATIGSADTVTLYDASTGALLTPSSGSASTNVNPVPLTVGTELGHRQLLHDFQHSGPAPDHRDLQRRRQLCLGRGDRPHIRPGQRQ